MDGIKETGVKGHRKIGAMIIFKNTRLTTSLKRDFEITFGFSAQNLWYMRQFYLEYRDFPFLQQIVGEIPGKDKGLNFNKQIDRRGERPFAPTSDQMVYALYGLTKEEIELVEDYKDA